MRLIPLLCLLLISACIDTKKADLDAWTFHNKLNGGMRLDRDPRDAPVDRDLIIRNFRKIAYDLEVDPFGTGEPIPEERRKPLLKRWEGELRLSVINADSASLGAKKDAEAFMRKLGTLTNVEYRILDSEADVEDVEDVPNFLVFMGEGEFFDEAIDDLVLLSSDGDEEETYFAKIILDFFAIWHQSYSPCAGQSYTEQIEDTDTGRIFLSLVAIRTDLADPMTQSCIEEELTQSMGLMNDDDSVRPSLFNDDNEFALMTTHDELLLKILYDARLESGMTPENSMPIVEQIARDLMPND